MPHQKLWNWTQINYSPNMLIINYNHKDPNTCIFLFGLIWNEEKIEERRNKPKKPSSISRNTTYFPPQLGKLCLVQMSQKR